MSKIKYLINRIIKMNYARMFKVTKNISKKINKNYILVLLDIIVCGIKYGAGYLDYELFEMYNLNNEQRKTYLTRTKNNEFIKKYNKKDFIKYFDNKILFNKKFKKFLKREFIYLKEVTQNEAFKWIEDRKLFVAKIIDGSCGKGIKRIDTSEYSSTIELYNFLLSNNYFLLEEIVYQHEKLDKLHQFSVNTIRLVTITINNRVHYVGSFLRIGNGSFVDNLNSGGMSSPVDINTGIIQYPAADKLGKVYYKHPLTNVDIVGFKIPFWDEAKTLVESAAFIVPEIRYVGWDVAITKDGPVFIEANPLPGYDIYQLPVHTPNKIGVLPRYWAVEK